MTSNQIAFARQQEDARHNLATEGQAAAELGERKRSNLENESIAKFNAYENMRHNVRVEDETNRSNLVKEAETHRSNVAKETENYRHNTKAEALEGQKLSIEAGKAEEQKRTNKANENIRKMGNMLTLNQQIMDLPVKQSQAKLNTQNVEESKQRTTASKNKVVQDWISTGTSAIKSIQDILYRPGKELREMVSGGAGIAGSLMKILG